MGWAGGSQWQLYFQEALLEFLSFFFNVLFMADNQILLV